MEQNTKEKRVFIKKCLKWIILCICLVGFIAFTEAIFHTKIIKFDTAGYKFISTYLISDFATPIARVVTNFGGAYFLILISMILALIIKNRKIGLTVIANLGIIGMINLILKNILQRPRPTEYRLIYESGYSFPSGHSMASMAFYGFLIYLIYKYVKSRKVKWSLIILLTILIITIGVSRIYLGVHYTSDVIAGFLASLMYLILYTSLINRYILQEKK